MWVRPLTSNTGHTCLLGQSQDDKLYIPLKLAESCVLIVNNENTTCRTTIFAITPFHQHASVDIHHLPSTKRLFMALPARLSTSLRAHAGSLLRKRADQPKLKSCRFAGIHTLCCIPPQGQLVSIDTSVGFSTAGLARGLSGMSHSRVTRGDDVSSAIAHRAFGEDHEIYSFVRRLPNIGISTVAVVQSGFWISATYLTAFASAPALSPLLTAGGAALSFVFVGMVHTYLSRSVARMSVLGVAGTKLSVTTYSFGGLLSAPKVIDAAHLIGGPKRDDEKERHWTFGVQSNASGSTYYYIIDRKAGILDIDAVRAICSTPRGGSNLMVLAYKRQANEMKHRWHDWEQRKSN
jgi:hypothetical protein